jgi:opacity protein-like surface antigen
MKQIFTLFTTFALALACHGQANEQGNFNFDISGGAGYYGASMEVTYGTITDRDDDLNGASAYMNLAGEYSLLDRLSAGISYKRGVFYVDDVFEDKNTLNNIGIQGRYFLLNNDRFGIFANGSFSGSFLNQSESYENGSELSLKWSGTNLGIGAGFKWFWTDHIGMQFAYEYNAYNHKLKSVELDGVEDPLLDEFEIKQQASGSEVKLGLTFKL